MIFEPEIITFNNEIGLTSQLDEVLLLSNAHFPKLIFQDFMNQLKINKIPIGFIQNSGQLIEKIPNHLEEMDETIRFSNTFEESANNENIFSYFLLTKLLKTNFDLNDIYIDYQSKQILYFRSKIPFSNLQKNNNNKQIKTLFSFMTLNQKKENIDRFFILLGTKYQDKLMLFLTYLETKYNFKLNKSDFIEASLGQNNLNNLKKYIHQLF